jgi:FdhD protein
MPEDTNLEWVEYTRAGDGMTRNRERVVTEYPLEITVNGSHFTTVMITPMMKEEFVIGHLFGQGVIDDIAEVKSLTLKSNSAEVILSRKQGRRKSTGKIVSDFRVSRDDIFTGVSAILESKIYAETQAAHSAGLFRTGAEPVCVVEDIGRHNALDKVIGYALMNGVDLKHTFAASTGRMVSEMVSKVCRANIPVVATKTAVTSLGIEMGKKNGLTIVGFVREAGMKVSTDTGEKTVRERVMKIYTNPERIF